MENYGAAAAANIASGLGKVPQRPSELESGLAGLSGVIGYQSDLIEQLRIRLDKVLRPAAPETCSVDKEQSLSTELGMALTSRRNQLDNHNRALNDILDRLEV